MSTRHVWNPYTEPPSHAEWLNREVETAVREYVSEGYISLDIFDQSSWTDVVFAAGDPLDDVEKRIPLAQLLAEELGMFVANGRISDEESRRFANDLRSILVQTITLIDDLLSPEPAASSGARLAPPAAASAAT